MFYHSIYPGALRELNKAKDTDISLENNTTVTRIYDKRDDFDFKIVNFLHLGGDVKRSVPKVIKLSMNTAVYSSLTKCEHFVQ
jgi:hypothetical protein